MFKKINDEIIKALKNKDSFRANTLKLVKAELQMNQKNSKPKPEQDVVTAFYKKLSKGLDIDDIETKQPEFVKNLKNELAIIAEFTPKELSEDEFKTIIQNHLSLGNMGAIIKAVKEDVAEKGAMFDGKLVSSLIKQLLG
jgi:uncharacterized protein YqeY